MVFMSSPELSLMFVIRSSTSCSAFCSTVSSSLGGSGVGGRVDVSLVGGESVAISLCSCSKARLCAAQDWGVEWRLVVWTPAWKMMMVAMRMKDVAFIAGGRLPWAFVVFFGYTWCLVKFG